MPDSYARSFSHLTWARIHACASPVKPATPQPARTAFALDMAAFRSPRARSHASRLSSLSSTTDGVGTAHRFVITARS